MRRIRAEIQADRRTLADREAELDRFIAVTPDMEDVRAAALALVLERIYTGLEGLLERIVRAFDGDLDRGTADWHRSLLMAATLDVPQLRPAVLRRSAPAADELRRFRHFVRHAYAAPLDAARVLELAVAWQAACPGLAADLDGFETFLAELAARLDAGSSPGDAG
jgi:hypothetical protein